MEERRIPIHAIAGTSIGGVLARFYATGHRSADLEEIVSNANWDDLFRVNPKFEYRPVVEKQDWNRITWVFGPFNWATSCRCPPELVLGARLHCVSRETLGYSDVRNFDDLPIPFRCVTTDLILGEAVALELTGRVSAQGTPRNDSDPSHIYPNEMERPDSGRRRTSNLPTDAAGLKARTAQLLVLVDHRIALGLGTTLQWLQPLLNAGLPFAPPSGQVGRVRTLAPQHGANGPGTCSCIGFAEDFLFILSGEPPAFGFGHHFRIGAADGSRIGASFGHHSIRSVSLRSASLRSAAAKAEEDNG